MNLISKKDLLAITGISYGQLYRWKRERLIPEEWFIKQSAYTGQETFFPREQILSRIQSILDMKDKYSLEELARMLSPQNTATSIKWDDLYEIEEIDTELINELKNLTGSEECSFMGVIFIAAISMSAGKLGLNNNRCADIVSRSIPALRKLKGDNIVCSIIDTGNEYHTVFTQGSAQVLFDEDVEVIEQLSLSEIADRIKLKYKGRLAL